MNVFQILNLIFLSPDNLHRTQGEQQLNGLFDSSPESFLEQYLLEAGNFDENMMEFFLIFLEDKLKMLLPTLQVLFFLSFISIKHF